MTSPLIVLEARTAVFGGAGNLTTELFPRLAKILEQEGRRVVVMGGPPRSRWEHLARARLLVKASAVLGAGNRAAFAPRARRVVCVRDRLLVWNVEADRRRELEPQGMRFRVRRLLLMRALSVADAIIVPSRCMVGPVEDFRKRYRLSPRAKVHVIPHGHPSWHSVEARPFARPLRAIFPSHPGRHKNFELLARLLDISDPDLLRLSVTAKPQDPAVSGSLGELFRGVLDRVEFIGPVPREEMPGVYADHDVVLYPSHIESFGLPILEAMTLGLPFLASAADWAFEVGGDAGRYADPRDPHAWMSEIAALGASDTRHAEAGLRRARNFEWDRVALEYAELLLASN